MSIVDHLVGPPCEDFRCLTPLVIGLGLCQIVGVFEVVVLLSLLANKKRRAEQGSRQAALDCVLPAYRAALMSVISLFLLQLAILSLHVFLSFDPDSLFYFFVYYSAQETVTFFFLMTSVTPNSLRRAVRWAMLWGLYTAIIALVVAKGKDAHPSDVYDDFNTSQSSRVYYLCIDIPRFFAYLVLVRFLSVRPRSLLPRPECSPSLGTRCSLMHCFRQALP